MFETLRGLAFFALLVVFYPLPVTLVLASALRITLGWGERRFLLPALVAAAPLAYVVLFMKAGLFGALLPSFVPAALIVATLVGFVCWVLAARRGGMEHFWLEPLVMVASMVYLLLAVPSWIAH